MDGIWEQLLGFFERRLALCEENLQLHTEVHQLYDKRLKVIEALIAEFIAEQEHRHVEQLH